jgi:hypothetical protein
MFLSLRVRMPVLSEQMTVTEPRVSTAVSLRVIALRRTIRCTPIARVMVMIAGKPSGIAATAKPTAAEKSSSRPRPCNSQPIKNIATAIPRITKDNVLPKEAICLVSGVASFHSLQAA